MAKILLDIGAHTGETASIALLPRWNFDAIFSFEPASNCWPQLDALAQSDDRLHIIRAALWNSDGTATLYGAGSVGASMFKEKEDLDPESICTISASDWFKNNISESDIVFAKINCEGAELEIIEDLVRSGQISKIYMLVVHFDLRKVPSRSSDEGKLVDLLNSSDIEWLSADEIFFGRNVQEKTNNWLEWCTAGTFRRWYYRQFRSVEYFFRVRIYRARNHHQSRAG